MSEQEDLFENLDIWAAERLRFTGFYEESISIANTRLFDSVLQTAPDELRQTNKAPSMVQESGPFGEDNTFQCEIHPDRFHLNLIPAESKAANDLVLIGEYVDILKDFQGVIDDWFKRGECPPLRRIAFGAVLCYRLTDLNEGYALFNDRLNLDIGGARLVEFKINRRRTSQVIEDLEVNRLSSWLLAKVVSGQLAMSKDDDVVPSIAQRHAIDVCKLTLDVNSDPSHLSPLAEIGSLFHEFADMGSEIAANGDIQ